MGRLPSFIRSNQDQLTKSYGIHVAKIAGLPAELLSRADKILTQLENQGTESPAPMRETSAVTEQMSLFDTCRASYPSRIG